MTEISSSGAASSHKRLNHFHQHSGTSYDTANEIGKLYTGDKVKIKGGCDGSYVKVYSPKYDTVGWVNAGFLK